MKGFFRFSHKYLIKSYHVTGKSSRSINYITTLDSIHPCPAQCAIIVNVPEFVFLERFLFFGLFHRVLHQFVMFYNGL